MRAVPIKYIEVETNNNSYTFEREEIIECILSDIKERVSCRPLEDGECVAFEKIIGNPRLIFKPKMQKADIIELRDALRKHGLQYICVVTTDEAIDEYRVLRPMQFYIMGDTLEISAKYVDQNKMIKG